MDYSIFCLELQCLFRRERNGRRMGWDAKGRAKGSVSWGSVSSNSPQETEPFTLETGKMLLFTRSLVLNRLVMDWDMFHRLGFLSVLLWLYLLTLVFAGSLWL